MREIKFRAWREETKDMMPNNTLMQLLDLSAWQGYMVDPLNVAWMQFTGLTDKNGVDIYEGDIIKFENKNQAVEYSESHGFEPLQIPCDYDEVMPCMDDVEVIGNIHQNPELLT